MSALSGRVKSSKFSGRMNTATPSSSILETEDDPIDSYSTPRMQHARKDVVRPSNKRQTSPDIGGDPQPKRTVRPYGTGPLHPALHVHDVDDDEEEYVPAANLSGKKNGKLTHAEESSKHRSHSGRRSAAEQEHDRSSTPEEMAVDRGLGNSENADTPQEEEERYEVETILAKRKKGRRLEYNVKWVGFDEATWEAATSLDQCKQLIKIFEENDAEKQKATTKGKPKKVVGRPKTSQTAAEHNGVNGNRASRVTSSKTDGSGSDTHGDRLSESPLPVPQKVTTVAEKQQPKPVNRPRGPNRTNTAVREASPIPPNRRQTGREATTAHRDRHRSVSPKPNHKPKHDLVAVESAHGDKNNRGHPSGSSGTAPPRGRDRTRRSNSSEDSSAERMRQVTLTAAASRKKAEDHHKEKKRQTVIACVDRLESAYDREFTPVKILAHKPLIDEMVTLEDVDFLVAFRPECANEFLRYEHCIEVMPALVAEYLARTPIIFSPRRWN